MVSCLFGFIFSGTTNYVAGLYNIMSGDLTISSLLSIVV